MGKIIHTEFDQRSAQWERIRCGRLTASELDKIITPAKLQLSAQAHDLAYSIAAERIKGRSEEMPVTFDMERGIEMEEEARYQYKTHFAQVREVGFIENNDFGFLFGASPDGLLLNANGAIEIKCPRASGHLKTILEQDIAGGYMIQMQGIMMAGELDFVDFVSFHEGLRIKPIRVYRNEETIRAITQAGKQFEEQVNDILGNYHLLAANDNSFDTALPKEIEL